MLCPVCWITQGDIDAGAAKSTWYNRHAHGPNRSMPACEWALAANRRYMNARASAAEGERQAFAAAREIARSAVFGLPHIYPMTCDSGVFVDADCQDCDWWEAGSMADGLAHAKETGHEVEIFHSRIYTTMRRTA